MSSKAITLNQVWNYSCIIPANSHEVKKSLKEAVLISENPNRLRAHFAATAYGIKTLALSFFNAFAYFFLGVCHFTKEIFHCSCKEAFRLLGSNLADSIKSMAAAILGLAVVVVGFFFSRKIYSCFVERKDLPSSTSSLGTIPPKVETSSSTASIPNKTIQIQDKTQPFSPIVEQDIISSKHPGIKDALHLPEKSSNRFSSFPTVMTTHINSFLDPKSQSSFASVCKDLAQQARKRKITFVFDDTFDWKKIHSADDLLKMFKDSSNIATLEFTGSKRIPKDGLAYLGSAIKKGCFPKLKHLFFENNFLRTLSESQLELIPLIEGCSTLESIKAETQGMMDLTWEILQAISTHCKSLRTLSLFDFDKITPEQLETILKNLSQLKKITTRRFNDGHLEVLARCCPNLESITFWGAEKFTEKGWDFLKKKRHLKRIKWQALLCEKHLTASQLKKLLESLSSLEEIHFESYMWEDAQFKNLCYLPSTVKTLTLRTGNSTTDAGFETFPFLPNLEHLIFHHSQSEFKLTPATLFKIGERCPNLRYLDLFNLEASYGVRHHIPETALIQFLSKYPDLEYLNLSGMSYVSDEILKSISTTLPKLRFLALWGNGTFTNKGLTHLKDCHNLRYLGLGRNRFSQDFTPTQENVRALIPQLKFLSLEFDGFPKDALIEAGFPIRYDE